MKRHGSLVHVRLRVHVYSLGSRLCGRFLVWRGVKDVLSFHATRSLYPSPPRQTIDGVEFLTEPEVPEGVPLVADFTSTLMSRPVDVSKYGLIYASSGKNLGPSGFVLVIVKDSLLTSRCADQCTGRLVGTGGPWMGMAAREVS